MGVSRGGEVKKMFLLFFFVTLPVFLQQQRSSSSSSSSSGQEKDETRAGSLPRCPLSLTLRARARAFRVSLHNKMVWGVSEDQ